MKANEHLSLQTEVTDWMEGRREGGTTNVGFAGGVPPAIRRSELGIRCGGLQLHGANFVKLPQFATPRALHFAFYSTLLPLISQTPSPSQPGCCGR